MHSGRRESRTDNACARSPPAVAVGWPGSGAALPQGEEGLKALATTLAGEGWGADPVLDADSGWGALRTTVGALPALLRHLGQGGASGPVDKSEGHVDALEAALGRES